MFKLFAAATAALLATAPAVAQITVDGTRDVAYGTAKTTVTSVPAASGDFSNPTPFTDGAGYRIYLTSDANSVFGFLETDPLLGGTSAGAFANLYFDVETPTNGSDIGFEITNGRAFVPGVPGYSASPLAGLTYAIGAGGNSIEFSLANSLFTGPIAGAASGVYAAPGSTITLRLSQAFGYAAAGGPLTGADRLGQVTLGGAATGAVPEPTTWAMLLMGFGVAGFALRRRAIVRTGVSFA